MRVAVLGGGIAGLVAAHRLRQKGADVTLYEASDRVGGLGTWFEHDGHHLDRFYHVILDSDSHLLSLIEEIGLKDSLNWAKTKMGFFVDGRRYPFNTPLDLLRFGALGPIDRLRTGFAALYITHVLKDGVPLDDQLAHVWLRKLFGRRVYECLWEPLLTAKFGDQRERVPAYWIWNALNREKNGSEEVKAYVHGGFGAVAERLRAQLEASGVVIHTGCKVSEVAPIEGGVRVRAAGGESRFAAALSTLPLPLLRAIWEPASRDQVPQPDLDFQGVVNAVLVRKERLDEFYWTAVVNSDFPFQGIVETTHVLEPAWIGGRHLLYLMNYCSARTDTYALSDDEVKRRAIAGVQRLYPGFRADSVEAAYVFRTPHVEPVWTLGYLRRRPGWRIADTRVYIATTAQAYPMVTSWNTGISLANRCVEALLADHGLAAAAAPSVVSLERATAPARS